MKTVFKRIELELSKQKPIADGNKRGTPVLTAKLPRKGRIKRYLLTSAQNNTWVNKDLWANLLALSKHYGATILVGTFSYNQNTYGKLAVKKGTYKGKECTLWFDPAIEPYISDERIVLAKGLVWCGEWNSQPTAENPLSGLETYSHRKSAIFPHAKLAMRSVATMKGEAAKLTYTTGTVTLMNYIQKAVGLKAEHHHEYAFLVVEVNDKGNWWVRQVSAAASGKQIQDLNVTVENGEVTSTDAPVEAITYGDLHATIADTNAVEVSLDMSKTLQPKYQFLHDVLEGVTINHHTTKDPHVRFQNYLRGLNVLQAEIKATVELIGRFLRTNAKTIVVDSNHDSSWLLTWLREHDYRQDPANATLFLETQLEVYRALERNDHRFHVLEWLLRKFGVSKTVRFLRQDESFTICGKRIETGQHGHLGANGARGNPRNLSVIGRRANTGHTHSAGIYNGLYVAGTTSRLDWQYAKGPSSWTHSHIVTYPNGQRSIITFYAGKWRA